MKEVVGEQPTNGNIMEVPRKARKTKEVVKALFYFPFVYMEIFIDTALLFRNLFSGKKESFNPVAPFSEDHFTTMIGSFSH